MKKLGLVGGISWVSTIDYYRYINDEINKRLGGLNFAECVIYSINFADVQSVKWDNSFDLLYNACNKLKSAGAEAIVLCATTAHMMADQIEEKIGLPLIHIVDATAAAIHDQGMNKVGLLATKFTMEMDFYRTKLMRKGIETLVPKDVQTRDYIQRTLKEELGKGIIKQETKEAYISIIKELINEGAQGIVLGCTEIPMIIHPSDISIPLFDTTKIHSLAAVDFALGISE